MPTVQSSAPAVEPITLAEAKAHMRVDTDADDIYIDALIETSRLQIEDTFGLALIHQTWIFVIDDWPAGGVVELPVAPAVQLLAVRTYDNHDIATPVPLAAFQLDTISKTPRLALKPGFTIPPDRRTLNGIEITYRAGFAALPGDVPEALRQALRLLVAHWYDHRDASAINDPKAVLPADISTLLRPYRRPRLV